MQFLGRFSLFVFAITLLSFSCVFTQDDNDTDILRTQSNVPNARITIQHAANMKQDFASEMFTQTSIIQYNDTVIVSQRQITLAEQIANRELEAQQEATFAQKSVLVQPLLQVGACASSSLRLFDQPNFVGNEICLTGTGSFDLSTAIRSAVCNGTRSDRWYDFSWAIDPIARSCVSSFTKSNKVRSVQTGQFNGGMDPSDFNVCQSCAAWGANTSIPDLQISSCGFARTGSPPVCIH